MTIPKVKYFDTNSLLIRELAERIIKTLKKSIETNGSASLVVSGGSTPKTLFELLSQQELDWKKVTITLADERCVPQEDEASNTRLIRENLLQNNASCAQFIPLYENQESPEQAAINASNKLSKIVSYDIMLLGMGQDGHTASLFPEAVNLADALHDKATDCMAIKPVTKSNSLRLTLFIKTKFQSRFILHMRNKITLTA